MDGGGFHVEPDELRGYAAMLERAAGQFTAIGQHAQDKGGDTSGFTGLLAMLVPVVNGIVGLYVDALRSASRKLGDVKDALDKTAAGYEHQDQSAASAVNANQGALDAISVPVVKGGAR